MAVLSLAGQPNVGKSSIFNAFTRLRQHVGNWPGKTVEKKEGFFNLPGGQTACLIDLPGIYSLTSNTIEEIVARDFILQNKPDAIINVVDASNLERNLYLTTEIMDLERPVIIALNMADLAEQKGYHIDLPALAGALGLPVAPVVATRKSGLDEFYQSLDQLIIEAKQGRGRFHFSPLVEEIIENITGRLKAHDFGVYPLRWLVIKLLEGDQKARELVAAAIGETGIAVPGRRDSKADAGRPHPPGRGTLPLDQRGVGCLRATRPVGSTVSQRPGGLAAYQSLGGRAHPAGRPRRYLYAHFQAIAAAAGPDRQPLFVVEPSDPGRSGAGSSGLAGADAH